MGSLPAAASQPLEEVTARILHAERFNASTPMPTFAGTLTEAEARSLAEYVRSQGAALEPEQASARGDAR